MAQSKPCPVERWPGTVELPAYMNFAQYVAWRDGALAAREVLNANRPEGATAETEWTYDGDAYRHAFLSGICGVVEAWHLAGLPEAVTPDTFPFTPPDDALRLFNWLSAACTNLAAGVDGDDPKSPALSSTG